MLTELYYNMPQPYNAKFIYRNMYTTEQQDRTTAFHVIAQILLHLLSTYKKYFLSPDCT